MAVDLLPMLVATKCDQEVRVVSIAQVALRHLETAPCSAMSHIALACIRACIWSQGQTLADELQVSFFETSALLCSPFASAALRAECMTHVLGMR